MDRLEVAWHPEYKVSRSRNCRRFLSTYHRGITRVCLNGGRSKGKTTIIWPYLINLCCDIPGFKVVVTRKEYSTLVNSTLESLNKHILAYPFYDDRHNPWDCVGGQNQPKRFRFRNGSSIEFMGLRDPEQLRGLEMDIWWCNEASRLETLKAWILAAGSMLEGRGVWKRRGISFNQIIADTNPDAPTHPLYKLFHKQNEVSIDDTQANKYEWIDFQLTDNPAYSDDGITKNAAGERALAQLLSDHPEGMDRDRFVFGLWVAAEGQVLHNFNFDRDVIPYAPSMEGKHWTHYRSVDFGDDSPLVCMWSSLNRDNGCLVTHREWRRSRMELEQHADAIKRYSDEDRYEWTTADSAHPSERNTFEKHGIPTVGSPKDVKENMRLIRRRIGQGLWKVVDDLLIEKDPRLVQNNKCLNILDEIGALKYPEVKNNTPADELPDKHCERHGVDAMGYKVSLIDKPRPTPVEDWSTDMRFR